MSHWLKYTILALLILLLASWPLARQLEEAAIEGQVTDPQGPVYGASVEARNSMTGEIARTTSGTDGLYRLEGLKPGRYSLWVTAENHCSVRVERIVVDRAATVRHDIHLKRAGSISAACVPVSPSSF